MRLLALALLVAQPVPPRMPVDDEPSALACTFDAALSGSKCTYEAEPAAGDPRDNAAIAAEAGVKACAAAAKRDDSLRKDCENAVAAASLGAACSVSARLADTHARLTPQAQACVEAVRQAVARTSRAAALSLECCRCLGEAKCGVAASQCRHELADLMPGAALQSCMAKSCHDACAFVAPAKAVQPGVGTKPSFPVPESQPEKI